MELIEREILSDAEESDWGLFHTRWSVASHFPMETEAAVIDRCRIAMSKLVENGLVRLYWLSYRPATEEEEEAVAERKRLEEEVGFRTQRDVMMSVNDAIPTTEVEAILADDANWHPPVEDRYVAFAATEAGLKAYFALPPRQTSA
jgi:hypothetical protein